MVGLALVAGLAGTCAAAGGTEPRRARTVVSIDGERFRINGRPTNRGSHAEGLLLNSRMVQAVFDDANPETRSYWVYPDTGRWDPERNTRELVAALPLYARSGLQAITVNLQGGMPRPDSPTQPWRVSGFRPDGSLKPAWLRRLSTLIRAADDQGIVVILGLFYQAQDQVLRDDDAVRNAVDRTVDWVLRNGFRNVLIEIANEIEIGGFERDVLTPGRVGELVERARRRAGGRLSVSVSSRGGRLPSDDLLRGLDFVLLHGNGQQPAGVASMIDRLRARPAFQSDPKPIVFNEDSTALDNMTAAVRRRASWGYYDQGRNDYADGFQSPPVDWRPRTPPKCRFLARTAAEAGLADPRPLRLLVTDDVRRARARLLDGARLTGRAYVFVTWRPAVESVSFIVDAPSGSPPRHVEFCAPYDLATTGADGRPRPWRLRNVPRGRHTLQAVVRYATGQERVLHASFTVSP